MSKRPASCRLLKDGSVFPKRENRMNSRGKIITVVVVCFGCFKVCFLEGFVFVCNLGLFGCCLLPLGAVCCGLLLLAADCPLVLAEDYSPLN